MNLSAKLHRSIVKSVTIRGQWAATLQMHIYIYTEERDREASFNFQAKARVEKRVPERERERKDATGRNPDPRQPPLHGPPTPLRNCVRARYQLAESNLVFRGLGRLVHRKRGRIVRPRCVTSGSGYRKERERERETLDFAMTRDEWIISTFASRFDPHFDEGRGFSIF